MCHGNNGNILEYMVTRNGTISEPDSLSVLKSLESFSISHPSILKMHNNTLVGEPKAVVAEAINYNFSSEFSKFTK
jgi:hypothetical protein